MALVRRRAMDIGEIALGRQFVVDGLRQLCSRRKLGETQLHGLGRCRRNGEEEVLALVAHGTDDQRCRTAEVRERSLAHGEALSERRRRQVDRAEELAFLEHLAWLSVTKSATGTSRGWPSRGHRVHTPSSAEVSE